MEKLDRVNNYRRHNREKNKLIEIKIIKNDN
jgi:hypothetical protein